MTATQPGRLFWTDQMGENRRGLLTAQFCAIFEPVFVAAVENACKVHGLPYSARDARLKPSRDDGVMATCVIKYGRGETGETLQFPITDQMINDGNHAKLVRDFVAEAIAFRKSVDEVRNPVKRDQKD